MNKIGAVIAAAMVLAGAGLAWRQFAPAAHITPTRQVAGWIPDMRVSARQRSNLRLAREFGAWRFGCRRAPRNGVEVSNIGPCFVGIVMRKAGEKTQFVTLMLHPAEDGLLLGDISYSLGPIAIPSAILSPREGGQNLNIRFRKTMATGLVSRCPRSTCLTQVVFQSEDLTALRDEESILFSVPRPRGERR